MSSDPFKLYISAVSEFLDGTQDWDSDNHYVVLLLDTYTPDINHTTFADLSASECLDADYVPQDMSGESVTVSLETAICDADDINFGASVTITARYLAIVVGTAGASSGTDRIVGYMLMDNTPADIIATAQPLLISWGGDGVFLASDNGISIHAPFAVDIRQTRLINSTVPEYLSDKAQVSDSTSEFTGPSAVDQAPALAPYRRYIASAAYTGVADGVGVSNWEDSVGGGDLIQLTSGSQLTFYDVDANNMLPSLGADSSVRFMNDTTAKMLQPCTIIMILDVKSLGGWQQYYAGMTSQLVLGEYVSGGTFYISDGVTGPTNVGTVKLGTQFMAVRFDGSSTIFDHDTTRHTALNVGTTGLDSFRLGANNAGVSGADARYHELIFFKNLLTNDQIDDWYTYAVDTWRVGEDSDSATISSEASTDGADHLFLTDETSGTTMTDYIGTTDGTYTGSPTLDVDARFDLKGFTGNATPATDYASLSSSAVQSDAFSIICRFKTTDSTGTIWGVGISSTDRVIAYVQTNELKVQGYDGTNLHELNAGAGYNDGRWHTIACTYVNGTSIAMWVDGIFIGVDTITPATVTVSGAWLFTDGQSTAVDGFDGTVSTIEMYGSAQTDEFMLAKSQIH